MKKYWMLLACELLILHGNIFAMKEESSLDHIKDKEIPPLFLSKKPLPPIDINSKNGIRLPSNFLTPIRLDVVRFVDTNSSEKEKFWDDYSRCYASYVKKNTTHGLIYKASKSNDENFKFLMLLLEEELNLDESIERYFKEGIVEWLQEYFTRFREKKTSYNILHKAITNKDLNSLKLILGEELSSGKKIKYYCSKQEIEWIDKKLLREEAEKRVKRWNGTLFKARVCQYCSVCEKDEFWQEWSTNKKYSKIFNLLARYQN